MLLAGAVAAVEAKVAGSEPHLVAQQQADSLGFVLHTPLLLVHS